MGSTWCKTAQNVPSLLPTTIDVRLPRCNCRLEVGVVDVVDCTICSNCSSCTRTKHFYL